jgi:hypothetical protein
VTITVPEAAQAPPRRRPSPRPRPGAPDPGRAVPPWAAALPVQTAAPAEPDSAGAAPSLAPEPAPAVAVTDVQLAGFLARAATVTAGVLALDVAAGGTLAYATGTVPLGVVYIGVLTAAGTLAALGHRGYLLRPDLPDVPRIGEQVRVALLLAAVRLALLVTPTPAPTDPEPENTP